MESQQLEASHGMQIHSNHIMVKVCLGWMMMMVTEMTKSVVKVVMVMILVIIMVMVMKVV